MSCAKCDFYMPKDSSAGLLPEGKKNLVRLLQAIPLREAEQAAVQDGINAHERLIAKIADVPTPSGQTTRHVAQGLVSLSPVATTLPTASPPALPSK
jgi:hypothetical protein